LSISANFQHVETKSGKNCRQAHRRTFQNRVRKRPEGNSVKNAKTVKSQAENEIVRPVAHHAGRDAVGAWEWQGEAAKPSEGAAFSSISLAALSGLGLKFLPFFTLPGSRRGGLILLIIY
jgi:hypothetical protein